MTISANHTAPDTTTGIPTAEHEDALTEAVKKFGITVEDYMLPARHQIQMVAPELGTCPAGPHGRLPLQPWPRGIS